MTQDADKRHKLMAHMDKKRAMAKATDTATDMYHLGNVCWHSSDGYSPDVGISVGLGRGLMLFAGEIPVEGSTGWGLAIYPSSGDRDVIALNVDSDRARHLIALLAVAMSGRQGAASKGSA